MGEPRHQRPWLQRQRVSSLDGIKSTAPIVRVLLSALKTFTLSPTGEVRALSADEAVTCGRPAVVAAAARLCPLVPSPMVLAWRGAVPGAWVCQLNQAGARELGVEDASPIHSLLTSLEWVAAAAAKAFDRPVNATKMGGQNSHTGPWRRPALADPKGPAWPPACTELLDDAGQVAAAVWAWTAPTPARLEAPAKSYAEQAAETVLESMSDAFFAVDRDWTIIQVNARHVAVSQIPRERQLGRSFLDVFLSSPQSKKSEYWRSYHLCMQKRRPVSFEAHYPPLNIWTAVRAFPTPNGGMAVFFADITEQVGQRRRLSTEKRKFEAVFLGAPAPMALLRGQDLVFEVVNEKYTALMGMRALVGQKLLDAVPEIKDQPYPLLMRQVLASGQPYAEREALVRLVRRPGGELEDTYFDFSYSRVEDDSDQPYGVYIHAIDITDKVAARLKIEALAQDLGEALRAREEFLSIVAHELKTPVTSLSMQLQMARRSLRGDGEKKFPAIKLAKTLDVAIAQVRRLCAIIEDLLDASRGESAKMTTRFEPVDLTFLIREVIDSMAEHINIAKCGVQMHLADEVIVVCDRFRIEQVVINLLTNGIKYGAGSTLVIELRADFQGAIFSITDQGIGIAPDKQAKVFERFERAVSHRSISGLGLGLYISKQIVSAHGGDIRLRSQLGIGSCFEVVLPAHPPGWAGQGDGATSR